jgi:anti-anti-sigma regulatory factor
MPTRITEIVSRNDEPDMKYGTPGRRARGSDSDDLLITSERKPTLFKVEGTLHSRDAELLESICREVSVQTGRPVVLDLSDLCFLDSESAAVLCRMKREQGVSLEGLNLFIKKVVELADESEKAVRYLPTR